jgi:hypothetical protein
MKLTTTIARNLEPPSGKASLVLSNALMDWRDQCRER